jgi:hypothetical protein
MRRFAAVVVVALFLLVEAGAAKAHVFRIAPARAGHATLGFDLAKVKRARQARVVSGYVVVRRSRRYVSVAKLRRAVRRGSLTIRAHGGSRARLMVLVDRHLPRAPARLSATPDAGAVSLTWTAARDDVGVAAYEISRDGQPITRVAAETLGYIDAGQAPGAQHRYSVRAIDRVGRRSRSTSASGAAAAAAPGAATSSPSGEALPSGDVPGWRLIFQDDFTTNVPTGRFPAAVRTRWGAYDDGARDTSGNGVYAPSKTVSFHDGVLDMHLYTDSTGHLVAAPSPILPTATGTQLYGRYAVRFKADALPGYKAAWLLWPDSENWPYDGEIDFPEGDLNQNIWGFVHHQGATAGNDQDYVPTSTPFTGWHTAVLEWSPGLVRMYLDGQPVGGTTTRVPSTSMHWVLQTETSLSTVPSNATNGHVLIDWVSVWSPAG